jgi:hypothetical protein
MNDTIAQVPMSDGKFERIRAYAIAHADTLATHKASQFHHPSFRRGLAYAMSETIVVHGGTDEQRAEIQALQVRVYTSRFADVIRERVAALRGDADALEATGAEYLAGFSS